DGAAQVLGLVDGALEDAQLVVEDVVEGVGDDVGGLVDGVVELGLQVGEDGGADVVDELRSAGEAIANARDIDGAHVAVEEVLDLGQDEVDAVNQERDVIEEVEVEVGEDVGEV